MGIGVIGVCAHADEGISGGSQRLGKCHYCGCDALGHLYSLFHQMGAAIAHVARKVLNAGHRVFKAVFDGVNRICGDVEALQQAIKFTASAMLGFALYGKPLNNPMVESFGVVDDVIDAAGVLRDVPYFVASDDAVKDKNVPKYADDMKNGHKTKVIGKAAMLIADITGTIFWLGNMGVKFARRASMIGSISLLTVTRSFVAVGFTMYALDAIIHLIKREDVLKHAMILCASIAEIGLKTIALTSAACPVGVATLGLIASGTWLTIHLWPWQSPKNKSILTMPAAIIG